MPPARNPEENDSKNPGQQHYNQEVSGVASHLQNAENVAGAASKAAGGNVAGAAANIAKKEGAGWKYDPSQFQAKTTSKKSRRGPITALVVGLILACLGVGVATEGDSIFMININQVLDQKLNQAVGMIDDRDTSLFSLRVKNTLKGISSCSRLVSILCKYNTFSSDELEGLDEHGVSFTDKAGKPLTNFDDVANGKVRPAYLEFNSGGQKIKVSASSVKKLYNTNTEFRTAVQKGLKFNAEYASASGQAWTETKAKYGISKQAPLEDEPSNATEDELAKALADEVEGESKPVADETAPKKDDKDNPACAHNPCTDEDVTNYEKSNQSASELADGTYDGKPINTNPQDALLVAEDATSDAGKVGADVAKVGESALSKVGNTLSVDGYMNDACTAYNTVRAVGFAAKTVRALQIAKVSGFFSSETSAVMASATGINPGVFDFAANLISAVPTTTTTLSDRSVQTITGRSGTDAPSYQRIALGSTEPLDTAASSAINGGGLSGTLAGFDGIISTSLGLPAGTSPKNTCHFLSNPWVTGGSLLVGAILTVIPGVGEIKLTAGAVAQGAVSIALVAANFVLPSLLQNIIAGNVLKPLPQGEGAMNLWVSGKGAIFSSLRQYSGGAPETPAQAVQSQSLNHAVTARNNSDDAIAANPLNAGDPNTFAGILLTQFTRYMGSLHTISGTFGILGSILGDSFGSVFNTPTSADATLVNQYQTCQDEDYKAGGYATDDFCNIVGGIPPEYLDAAPDAATLTTQLQGGIYANDTVLDATDNPTLGADMQVDANGDPIGDYATYVAQCITRTGPYGSDTSDGGTDDTDGGQCFIDNQQEADLWIHYLDQYTVLPAVESGMTAS